MTKMWRRRMGGMILCSMACTTVMLAVQGRIREAIPLHLCSVSALAAAVLALCVCGALWGMAASYQAGYEAAEQHCAEVARGR